MNKILPSILGVEDLNTFLDVISESSIDEIHLDIMDGIFVENKYDNLNDITILKNKGYITNIHLMVENPDKQIDYALKLGADSITIHYEIDRFSDMFELLLKHKRDTGIKVGVSICPETDVTALKSVLKDLDIVLVMSVHPGKGGQTFMDNAYEKIKKLRNLSDTVRIIVDGGINDTNILNIFDCGADSVVVGSYITSDIQNADDKIKKLEILI